MDMPTKAIADLDYAFNGCITHGFIDPNDADIKTLKNILTQMAAAGQVTLNPATGLPKNGVIKASEAFTELAKNTDAKPAIENLHVKLKAVGIWLWTNGAIEQHIGIDGKNETCWAAFQTKAETDGIESICSDTASLKGLIQWLEE